MLLFLSSLLNIAFTWLLIANKCYTLTVKSIVIIIIIIIIIINHYNYYY